MSNNDVIQAERSFCISDDCAVSVVRGLRCPRCNIELRAEDLGADAFGSVAPQCSGCGCVIMAVSRNKQI